MLQDETGGGNDHYLEHFVRRYDRAEFPVLQAIRRVVRDLAHECLGVFDGTAFAMGESARVIRLSRRSECNSICARLARLPITRFQNVNREKGFSVPFFHRIWFHQIRKGIENPFSIGLARLGST